LQFIGRMATSAKRAGKQPTDRMGRPLCPECCKPLAPGRGRARTDGVRFHERCWKRAVDRRTPA